MILNIITSIVLGIVEGVTEFLPISSTGHLILVNQWLTFSESFTELFDVVIQLGAVLAALVYFWPKISKFKINDWIKVAVAVVPVLVIGALLGSYIQKTLFNPITVGVMLVLGGFILLYVEKRPPQQKYNSILDISWKTALWIGLIQCISMIPGTSRSAATIVGALFLGMSRSAAVEFSFFLAIPTMIAASGYSVLKHGISFGSGELVLLILGFAIAFLTALLVIKYFIKYIQSHNFIPFAYYRIVLGVVVLIYFSYFK